MVDGTITLHCFVIKVNVMISEHISVFQSLLFVSVRIVLTGDVHRPGQNSEMVEIDHRRHKPCPDVQFLYEVQFPLDQLHGFLRVPP